MIGKIRVFLCRSRTFDRPIASSDALPLTYRGWSENSEYSFAGIEPSTFRLLVRMLYHWAIGDDRKNLSIPLQVVEPSTVRLLVRMLYHWPIGGDRKIRSIPLQVFEPSTFRLLVRMLYHWPIGDPWEHIASGLVPLKAELTVRDPAPHSNFERKTEMVGPKDVMAWKRCSRLSGFFDVFSWYGDCINLLESNIWKTAFTKKT